jgi:hypothetical protein
MFFEFLLAIALMFHPKACILEMSMSFLGVPSGFDASHILFLLCAQQYSEWFLAKCFIVKSSPVPILYKYSGIYFLMQNNCCHIIYERNSRIGFRFPKELLSMIIFLCFVKFTHRR